MDRKTYVIAYFASAILSGIVFSLTKNFLIFVLCMFVLRFAVNFYYGHTLKAPTAPKVFASIFGSLGFLYLMGYDNKLIGAWNLFISSVKLYRKNISYLLTYVILIYLTNIILVMSMTLIRTGIAYVLNNLIGSILQIVLIIGYLLATILVNTMLYMAMIKGINEARENKAQFKNIYTNFKSTYKIFWRFIGAALLKFVVANGPLLIGMITFAAFSITAIWGWITSGTVSASLFKFGPVNIIIGLVVFYGFIHSTYLTLRLMFNIYGILFEQKQAKESLYYSMNLSKKQWWQILWRVFIPTWLVVIAVAIVTLAFGWLVGNQNVRSIISLLLQVLVTPLTFVFPYLLYVHLKNPQNVVATEPKAVNQDEVLAEMK